MALPAISGGLIYTTDGIRYRGMNYYDFPYDAEQKPSLRAVDNILQIVQDLKDGGLKVIIEELNPGNESSLYKFKLTDLDDPNRVIRESIDAHNMIQVYITGGKDLLAKTLYPDFRYSA